MFSIGSRIVCVDNREGDFGFEVNLTIGKVYIVITDNKIKFGNMILDDKGLYKSYKSDRFILLKEYRKRKIERCFKGVM